MICGDKEGGGGDAESEGGEGEVKGERESRGEYPTCVVYKGMCVCACSVHAVTYLGHHGLLRGVRFEGEQHPYSSNWDRLLS